MKKILAAVIAVSGMAMFMPSLAQADATKLYIATDAIHFEHVSYRHGHHDRHYGNHHGRHHGHHGRHHGHRDYGRCGQGGHNDRHYGHREYDDRADRHGGRHDDHGYRGSYGGDIDRVYVNPRVFR